MQNLVINQPIDPIKSLINDLS